jgi:regulator of sigma E protease
LHEWGHYIVARLCGVKVLTYSIGFGPKLAGWTSKRSGIDYRVSALPLGGYVKMLDEREGEVAEHEQHLAFNRQHPLKKNSYRRRWPHHELHYRHCFILGVIYDALRAASDYYR